MDPLVRRAIAVDHANMALGHEVFRAAGATFVRDPRLPIIHDANHVREVRAALGNEIDALLARVHREFAHCGHRQFLIDPDTPPEFESRLVVEGYQLESSLVMLLEGPLAGAAKPHTVRLVATDADWAEYARLKHLEWGERAARFGVAGLDVRAIGDSMIEGYRQKAPPLRYWVACVDGTPRGFLSSWEGPEGVGQVEDLFVEEPFRHRGLATALIHRGVADARTAGAGPVAIVTDTGNTAKAMYAAMGFRPVAVLRKYTRHRQE